MASLMASQQQPQEQEQQIPTLRHGKRKSGNDDDDDTTPATLHGKGRTAAGSNVAALLLENYDHNVGSDYNSDEEPQAKEASQEYTRWRLEDATQEAEDSLSDWTIQIVATTTSSSRNSSPTSVAAASTTTAASAANEETNDEVVVKTFYHVHKYVLATGPRRGEYFARLFQHGFFESQSATSRIELDELAAQAFPLLLDFLYAPPDVADNVPFTTENATALYSLAKYFEIRRLTWLAKTFWKKDMLNSATCGMYYEHGKILQQDAVVQAASMACAKYILEIPTGATTVTGLSTTARRYLLDTEFWQHYLSAIAATNNNNNENGNNNNNNNANTITMEFSEHLSLLLVEYFRETPDTVYLEQFHDFTNVTYLPHIHFNAALPLLDMERELAVTALDNVPSVEESTTADERSRQLQERCIEALSKKWDCIEWNDEPYKSLLQKQDVAFTTKIFIASLTAAKATKDELVTSCQAKQEQIDQLEQERSGRRQHVRVIRLDAPIPGNRRVMRAAQPAAAVIGAAVAAPPPRPARPAAAAGVRVAAAAERPLRHVRVAAQVARLQMAEIAAAEEARRRQLQMAQIAAEQEDQRRRQQMARNMERELRVAAAAGEPVRQVRVAAQVARLQMAQIAAEQESRRQQQQQIVVDIDDDDDDDNNDMPPLLPRRVGDLLHFAHVDGADDFDY